MYLFPQPREFVEKGLLSKYIHGESITEFTEELSAAMGRRSFEEWVSLLSYGGQVAAHITCSKYENILVCTSYDNSKSTVITDKNDKYNISSDAGTHMFPIVWKRMECAGNVYVTKPSVTSSIFEKGYEALGVKTLRVDDYYHIDHPRPYNIINAPVAKFDAVVLLTPKKINPNNNKFKITEIKKDFARYCKEDFDIITLFEPDYNTQIVGSKKKKTSDVIKFTSAQINPNNYEDKYRDIKYDVTGKRHVVQSIGYFNLQRFYNKVVNQFRIF
jgi:hypothetical protein